MRLIKLVGLAVSAAAVIMAIAGAGSATAAPDTLIGLCTVNALNCAGGSTIDPPAGGSLRILLKTDEAPELKGSLNESCPESTSTLSGKETMKNPILGSVTALTFGPAGKCSPCPTVTAQGLPYAAELSMSVEGGTEYAMTTKGSAKLENCLGLGITCKFGGEVKFTIKNTATGILGLAEGKELKLEEGNKSLCGSTGSLKAHYVSTEVHLVNSSGTIIASHKPAFIVLLE